MLMLDYLYEKKKNVITKSDLKEDFFFTQIFLRLPSAWHPVCGCCSVLHHR